MLKGFNFFKLTKTSYYHSSLLIFCLLTSTAAFSTENLVSNNSLLLSKLNRGNVVLTIGGYQGWQGRTQHINLQGLIGNSFTVKNHHYKNAFVGLSYFINGNKWGTCDISYGLNAFYLAPTAVWGNVIQEDLLDNLSYHYNIANYPLYLMAKFTFPIRTSLDFSLDIGAGPNYIKTYDFKEKSLDNGFTSPEDMFLSNTTTKLSATIGTSLKMNHALGQIPLEIGYRFFYLGQGYLKPANDQVLSKLKTGTIFVNSIFLAISL